MELTSKDISTYLQLHRTPAGAILKHILNRLGMSQAQLASKIQIPPQHINAMIKSTRRFSPRSSIKIETALGIVETGFFFKCQCNHDIYLALQAQMPKPDISNLSKSTFWDVDLSSVNWQEGKQWAILRVLEYGRTNDYQEISKFYGASSFSDVLEKLGTKATHEMLRNARIFGLQ